VDKHNNGLNDMQDLHTEVNRFKQWASTHNQRHGEWECDYEHWGDLWSSAESAINRFRDGNAPDEIIDDLIYAIARDNEDEIIAEHLLHTPPLLTQLAKSAMSCSESDAKWQIAQTVAEAKLDNAAELIRPFLQDENEYVRRRALLAFGTFSPQEAEQIALTNLNDEFEYSRIAALHVLHDIGSERLLECLDRHETDPSEYVRWNVREIRSEIRSG
jgi:hypothetical protein